MLSSNDLAEVKQYLSKVIEDELHEMINDLLSFLDTASEDDVPASAEDRIIDLLANAKMDMGYAVSFDDEINHPSHYTQYKGVEVIEITERLPFVVGNAVKYLLRAGHKKGTTRLTDLRKCLWYVDRSIESGIVANIYKYDAPKLIKNCELVYDQLEPGLVKAAYAYILAGEMENARECLFHEIDYIMEEN